MTCTVHFIPEVWDDLRMLGTAESRRVLKVIRDRIVDAVPGTVGKPHRGPLAGHHCFRTADVRIVYRVEGHDIVVVLCDGGYRVDEVSVQLDNKHL